MKITANRYHDISVGHRVVGHEGKCRHLHGHNYRIHFYCEAVENQLDEVGRVIDFSVIKEKLCMWLEDNWDHRFIYWERDELCLGLNELVGRDYEGEKTLHSMTAKDAFTFEQSMIKVPFNPTAENMADYLLNVIAPHQLSCTGVICTKIIIEETRKCSVEATL